MSICPNVLYEALLEDVRPWLRDHCGPEASREEVAVKLLANGFLKKFEEFENPDADKAALSKFLAVNDRCRNWTLKVENSWDDELLGTLKKHLSNFWTSLQVVDDKLTPCPLVCHIGTILDEGVTGPGASLDANGADLYSKLFSSRLTMTRSYLLDAYKRHFAHDVRWREAENLRDATYGSRIVLGNKLAFVPKTRDISRTTCTEPSLNMFYQLGFGAVLRRRLEKVFLIDDDQPYWNRQLAKLGSISGGLATIDLSSASDSMSLGMLREVLPEDFVYWLDLLRSPMCRLPDGTDVELHMVSTMGNGYTFPLQTMLFACCVAAVYEQLGIKLQLRSGTGFDSAFGTPERRTANFAVWGDDIICSHLAVGRLFRLLSLLGFEVNADKSFYDQNDPFRESCGYDYHRGEDVRAVYCRVLSTTASRFALINRLNRWSASQGIPLRRTVALLLDTVPVLPVPRRENDDAGVKVPMAYMREKGWLTSHRKPKDDKSPWFQGSAVYKRWCPRSVTVDIPQSRGLDDAFKYPTCVKRKKLWNPQGLHIAWLGGYIRDGRIGVRVDVVPYRTRLGISSYWDAPPDDLDRLSPDGWSRWASATRANLR